LGERNKKVKRQLLIALVPLVVAGRAATSTDTAGLANSTSHSRGVSVPKVEGLFSTETKNPDTVLIDIDTNGGITVVSTPLSLQLFGSVISKLRADMNGVQPDLHLRADASVPFEKMWPILTECCGRGVYKVEFVVAGDDQRDESGFRVFLPVMASNSPYQSPLTITADATFVAIGVQTNGYAVGNATNGVVMWRQNLESQEFVQYIQSIGERDKTTTIVVIPSQGVTHGDVASAIRRCWRSGSRNIALVREDALKTAGSDAKQTAPAR